MFEFDPVKSAANKTKHGIDFVEVQALWRDPLRLEVQARALDELRLMTVGKIGAKHWSVIFTIRAEKIRIISARRSRDNEVAAYESL